MFRIIIVPKRPQDIVFETSRVHQMLVRGTGNLVHKKPPPPRTLPYRRRRVLWGGGSYERGTPAGEDGAAAGRVPDHGHGPPWPVSSHTMCCFNGCRKSAPPENRRLIVHYY